MTKIKDTVSWVMMDESVLKLEKAGTVLELDPKVLDFMKKTELSEDGGYEVEVEVDESKGENGTIVRLTTGKDETAKKEEKTEEVKNEEPSEDTVIKELTVAGVSTKNRSVTFKEEDKVWYNLGDDLDAEKVKTEFTKKKVSVSIVKTDKGNDVIKSIASVGPEEDPSNKDTEGSPTSTDSYEVNTQKSIEAQVAVEHAQILAGKLAESGKLADIKDINSFVDERARKNYQLMQEVKKSV